MYECRDKWWGYGVVEALGPELPDAV